MLDLLLQEGALRYHVLTFLFEGNCLALSTVQGVINSIQIGECRVNGGLSAMFVHRETDKRGVHLSLEDLRIVGVLRCLNRLFRSLFPSCAVMEATCTDVRIWQALLLMKMQSNEVYAPPLHAPQLSVWTGGDLLVAAIALSDVHVNCETSTRELILSKLSPRVWFRCWNAVRARASGLRAIEHMNMCTEVELRSRSRGEVHFNGKLCQWVPARHLGPNNVQFGDPDRVIGVRVLRSIYVPSTNNFFGADGCVCGEIAACVEALRCLEDTALVAAGGRELLGAESNKDSISQLASYSHTTIIGGDDLDMRSQQLGVQNGAMVNPGTGLLTSEIWGSRTRAIARAICGSMSLMGRLVCMQTTNAEYTSELHVLLRAHPVWTDALHPIRDEDIQLDKVTPLSGWYFQDPYQDYIRQWCIREDIHGSRHALMRAAKNSEKIGNPCVSVHLPNKNSMFRGAAPSHVTGFLDSIEDAYAMVQCNLERRQTEDNNSIAKYYAMGTIRHTETVRAALMDTMCPIPAIHCVFDFHGNLTVYRLGDAYDILDDSLVTELRSLPKNDHYTSTVALQIQDLLIEHVQSVFTKHGSNFA